jgi:SP family facilitated glucose transporter-like MFS transporter 8
MAIQVVMTGVSCVLMDRAGRKLLLIISFSGMAVCAFLLGLYFAIQPAEGVRDPWLMIVGVFGYVIAFSLGAGPVPWLLMAEIFPADVRGTACTIATVTNWTGSFLVTLTVDPLSKVLTYMGLFWVYSGVCLLGVFYAAFVVVETKGKSLEEITAMLASGQQVGQTADLLRAPLATIPSPTHVREEWK